MIGGHMAAPTDGVLCLEVLCWNHMGRIGAREVLLQKEGPRALPREAEMVCRQNSYT